MYKPRSRGSLHVSIWIGIDPEGAALFFTRNKVPANGNCCSPCIQKQLLSFLRGSMAGKMDPSMDECSRPVCLTSQIEETQNLTSQSCVFSLRHQKSVGDLHKNSSLSLTFLQWQHLLELALVAQQHNKPEGRNKQQTQQCLFFIIFIVYIINKNLLNHQL
jgi:hypothetical protein